MRRTTVSGVKMRPEPPQQGHGLGLRLVERGPHPLAGHLDQAQVRDLERLGARAVAREVGAQLLEHLLAVLLATPCR